MDQKGEKFESVEDTGSPNVAPPTRGQRFKRHCGRRWWIYLIIFLILVLVGVIAIIFGIIPRIAQNSVSSSSLQVDGIAITSPSNSEFTLAMNSTVNSHAPVSASFSPQTFEMYLPPAEGKEPVPFINLSIGSLKVEDTFTINVTDAKTAIMNEDAYMDFSAQVLGREELELGVRSRPQINVGAIKFNVNYQKIVKLRGLNGLKGIKLYNATILDTPLPDGTNMITDGILPNPSSFTLQVGDLTVDMAFGTWELGWSVVKDLTLYPGDNAVKIYNHVKPEIIKNLLFVSSTTAPRTNITLTANSTVFNGQHINWLEKPLHDAPPVIAVLNP
ncbi:hypothetical protein DRE_00064 [Drechslerella stenobrocha 248]|uniref:Uncharacterized protein n=1 Tax=Drechslerella stenobrocha 248 TaxID=1043628 RepID=W7HZ19_9PEZI|nr:hypothetical protein DRE_00064 [Drechslerella stenobrocha 248]